MLKNKLVILSLMCIIAVTFFVYKKSDTNSVVAKDSPSISGIRITGISKDSPAKNVLSIGDIITGVSRSNQSADFADIITRKRTSPDFLLVNSIEDLNTILSTQGKDKVILGVVRNVSAGTGYYDKPLLVPVTIQKIESQYTLGIIVTPVGF